MPSLLARCLWAVVLVQLLAFELVPGQTPDRLRVLLETDAGGDPDDEQSLVRFLAYCNEWDVEAIICNRPQARERENRNRERTGLGIVQQLVRAYSASYPHLRQHDARYPDPQHLLEHTVPGHSESREGVDRILAAVDSPDPRPLWYIEWGSDRGSGEVNMRRALDEVLKERGPDGYARFKSRLRIAAPDQFGEHTAQIAPAFPLWVNTFQPPVDGKRWYHRFSALTATAGGFDLERDVLHDHGPLGDLYPTNTTHRQKEGDTMTFLYLVPTGMNDPEHPGWGSWAGRYGRNPEFGDRNYYWANQADSWQGTTHRDNTLGRWAADLQNDFRCRMDWCVRDFAGANHPPQVRIEPLATTTVRGGARLELNASGTRDPDGDGLQYEWIYYPEPGGDVPLAVVIRGETMARARVILPTAAQRSTVHIVLRVTDQGTPPLARYGRVVLVVEPG
ncbi:MAG: nucleoside hydrolase-like domain-containing protein [Pirellulaceae bacterium]